MLFSLRVPVGKHFSPAVFRRYVRRWSEEKSLQGKEWQENRCTHVCRAFEDICSRRGERSLPAGVLTYFAIRNKDDRQK